MQVHLRMIDRGPTVTHKSQRMASRGTCGGNNGGGGVNYKFISGVGIGAVSLHPLVVSSPLSLYKSLFSSLDRLAFKDEYGTMTSCH